MERSIYYMIATAVAFIAVFILYNYKYFSFRYISLCEKSNDCPQLKKQIVDLKKFSKGCGGSLTDDMSVTDVYTKLANIYWFPTSICDLQLIQMASKLLFFDDYPQTPFVVIIKIYSTCLVFVYRFHV
jgi:hypothetical protein